MEHRQSLRLSTNAQLHLYRHGKLVCTGRLREVSRDGLFVATDMTEVGSNQVLEFVLTSEDQPSGLSLEGKAMVVHKTDQGLGLMLQEGQHQAGIRQLYSWLLRKHRNSQCRAARPNPRAKTGSHGIANC